MRIIIAGGSGLIGTELTKELCQKDHEVVILSRKPENVRGVWHFRDWYVRVRP